MNNFDYNRAIFASDLSTNAKITGLAIAVHYNWKTNSMSYPSIKMLIKETSLSKASIHRAKRELIDRGFMASQRRFNNSNLYLPQIPASLIQTLEGSHTEELKDNIKDNLIDNNQGEQAPLISNEIWRVFDNEERYTRRHAAGGRNKVSKRINTTAGRHNSDSAAVTGHAETTNGQAQW